MKSTLIALVACALFACSAQAYTFKIKVDLASQPEKQPVQLTVPKGAEKASARYFRLAEKTHPDLLAHGFAAPPGQATFKRDDDPLDDLAGGLVDDDAILTFDKDVEYVIRAAGRRSFVLMIVNRKNEDLTADVELKIGKMFEPVYRRVYSEDGGNSWTTAAWQPPRASDLYPWPVEVPANTVQTITICLK